MPKVSICCPCYNSEKYIKETVSSVINQSFKDIEIIIADDFSSDNTYNVIKNNFNDNRIKLFKQEKNLGPSLNSEFVVDKANSEYLALIAGDDVMHVNRIAKCYEFMQQNPDCDMVYTYIDIIDESSKKIFHPMQSVFNQNKTMQDMLRYFFYDGNFICATSIMIKKLVLQKLNWNPCLLQLQDFDMWTRMLLNGFKIICLPEKLTYYRIHADNLSLQNSKRKLEIQSRNQFEYIKVLQNFIKYINKKEQFTEIFQKTIQDEQLIPFAIAQEALSKTNRIHYLFALDVIYNEMLDDEKRELILQYYQFEMKDFYKLCNNFIERNNIITDFFIKIKRKLKRLVKIVFKSLRVIFLIASCFYL